jgi:integrase
MRIRLKGIASATKKLADGSRRRYWYAWRGGPKLEGTPGSPAFMASYHAAIEGRKTIHGSRGTLAGLIAGFRASHEFESLSDHSKNNYGRALRVIGDKFGTMSLSALQEPTARGVFKEWREEIARAKPATADYYWMVLGRVLSVAKDRGHITANVCERGGQVFKRGSRKDKIWTAADEAAFLARAPERLHLPLLLALWTGQRLGDLLALTWMQYDGRVIRLRQGKTGARVVIPASTVLKAALDPIREFDGPVLLTSRGTPWTTRGFHKSWQVACEKAGVTGLTFHDLRGSAVTRLAQAGCTVPEIASITGHSLSSVHSILDTHYLNRDGLAESAIAKLERGSKPANRAANRPADED